MWEKWCLLDTLLACHCLGAAPASPLISSPVNSWLSSRARGACAWFPCSRVGNLLPRSLLGLPRRPHGALLPWSPGIRAEGRFGLRKVGMLQSFWGDPTKTGGIHTERETRREAPEGAGGRGGMCRLGESEASFAVGSCP